tara:strand:- start:49 stop:645 length:597 start_codon:yes stop_codon:yes gene_type:complete
MSKKTNNVLVNEVNLNSLYTNVKAIFSKESGLQSANARFVKWASELYKGQKNIHLNFTNPNTKKSNLTKEEYDTLKDTIAKALYSKEDYKLYMCDDITATYGFKKKTKQYKGKAEKKRLLKQQPASRANKLVDTLEKALTPKVKGASRQGSKFDQIDKLFATLVTKLNANADKLTFIKDKDLEVMKGFITNARSCISK